MKDSFLRGTFMLTVAAFIVKIFGFIYVIPFIAMVGPDKYILFEYAYKPYIILLSLATLGIPNAVSKFVSKYREKRDFHIIRALLRSGAVAVTLLGIVSFGILYCSAGMIASLLINPDDPTGNTQADVIYVIRMVSYSLIIVPLLALIRGFIQGFQSMGPTSMSQVVEQVVRIIIILLGTYIIIYVMNESPVKAVGLATFSSFISAIVALIIVLFFLYRRDFGLKEVQGKVSYRKLYRELFLYAIPFVFVGLSIPLLQSIDTFMINSILMKKGLNVGEAETINALVSLVQKIVVIPVALATAFSVSIVAYITNAYQAGRSDEITNNINKAIQVLMFFILPSAAGTIVLAKPIFGAIYGMEFLTEGSHLLRWYSLSALFYSLFTITAAILQGLDQQRWVVYTLLIGLSVKVVSNFPLIFLLNGEGTAVSTYLALFVVLCVQMFFIQKRGNYVWSENLSLLNKVIKQTLQMSATLLPLGILSSFFDIYAVQASILLLGICLGGGVYITEAYKNKTLFSVISKSRIDSILMRFRLTN